MDPDASWQSSKEAAQRKAVEAEHERRRMANDRRGGKASINQSRVRPPCARSTRSRRRTRLGTPMTGAPERWR
jgi:hypothetical protein